MLAFFSLHDLVSRQSPSSSLPSSSSSSLPSSPSSSLPSWSWRSWWKLIVEKLFAGLGLWPMRATSQEEDRSFCQINIRNTNQLSWAINISNTNMITINELWYQLSIINYPLSLIRYQLSGINNKSSGANWESKAGMDDVSEDFNNPPGRTPGWWRR